LLKTLKGGNAMNIVIHGIHSIHFSTTKRFMRKRSVR